MAGMVSSGAAANCSIAMHTCRRSIGGDGRNRALTSTWVTKIAVVHAATAGVAELRLHCLGNESSDLSLSLHLNDWDQDHGVGPTSDPQRLQTLPMPRSPLCAGAVGQNVAGLAWRGDQPQG